MGRDPVEVRIEVRKEDVAVFFIAEAIGQWQILRRPASSHYFRTGIARDLAAVFVKPYVKSNKNDANDAEAICEAMSRPGMRFVAVKTVEQQDVQAVHRARAGLMEQRNAKANQIRGLTSEYGIVAPREILQLRRAVPVWLEDVNSGLSDRFRRLLTGLWEDLRYLDDRIRELDREIAAIASSDPVARRLQQLRGVGPMVATAFIATVGNARQFANGRQMAASLGLTPRQNSSGGKERLLGISKRGDAYVRCLLIHGARDDPDGQTPD